MILNLATPGKVTYLSKNEHEIINVIHAMLCSEPTYTKLYMQYSKYRCDLSENPVKQRIIVRNSDETNERMVVMMYSIIVLIETEEFHPHNILTQNIKYYTNI